MNREDTDIIDSPMEIGGEIHTQSDIITSSSPHLPKDTKYSKFNNIDVSNYILKSRTYQLWKYTKKIQDISRRELNSIKDLKKQIYDIKTKLDLKNHLESIGKSYIWYNICQIPEKEFDVIFKTILTQLKTVKDEGIIENIYGDKDNFYESYNDFLEDKEQDEDVDDFGLMNTMLTLTEVKKAHKGWGMDSMNTTINITKSDEISKSDDSEENEEQQQKKRFFQR